jgi:c-di-GMP-binding flagellar brake protein YcgR
MGKIVQSSRIACEAECILKFDGGDYEGVIENISLTGALIKLDNGMPDNIRPGDTCDMIFCSRPDVYPLKYTSTVVRLDSALIGIEFLELNIM